MFEPGKYAVEILAPQRLFSPRDARDLFSGLRTEQGDMESGKPAILVDQDTWPLDGLETVSHCPVCGGRKRMLLYEGLTDRVFHSAPGQWNLHQCLACGCAYLDPRPSPETVGLAYCRYYTHAQSQRVPFEQLSPLRRFLRSLANGYRNQRFGGRRLPASRFGPLVIAVLPGIRRALNRELRYLPFLEQPGARLLDVGFGGGDFLLKARDVGWQVAGVDPDEVVVSKAKAQGLDVRQGGIEAYADRHEYFDVITLNHVLEHVHDAPGALRYAHQMLKRGGRLFLETPNIDAAGHRRFRECWRGLEIPRHLVLFNWRALELMLARVGFTPLERIVHVKDHVDMASKSQTIKKGLSPNQRSTPGILERARGAAVSWRTRWHFQQSEFVTLIAHKPR